VPQTAGPPRTADSRGATSPTASLFTEHQLKTWIPPANGRLSTRPYAPFLGFGSLGKRAGGRAPLHRLDGDGSLIERVEELLRQLGTLGVVLDLSTRSGSARRGLFEALFEREHVGDEQPGRMKRPALPERSWSLVPGSERGPLITIELA
jgi:hypothetical protein